MSAAKPYRISKWAVWKAYQKVRANKGAAGVDAETLSDFEGKLQRNLYKIWNRMSSGSYFPPPVRMVAIPKKDGRERVLGIPTVSDRIAQMVVKMALEPQVEPQFHRDSYGYRPGKSAIEAVGTARQRCWRNDWVLDLDIRSFFDTIDHPLMMRAVRQHTSEPWILLYIERWLKAPGQKADGTTVTRERGTPQGGVISPLLANLFLHYAFDLWMARKHPGVQFERYADDIIVHCGTEAEAQGIRKSIEARLAECKLQLHPEKTRIVYCKDANRKEAYPTQRFDFLGYTFRPRSAKNGRGELFASFSPAISDQAKKDIRQTIKGWHLQRRSDKSLEDLSRMFNPVIRGWVNYYGRYHRSALYAVFRPLRSVMIRWATRKYKKLRGHRRRAGNWLDALARREPGLFEHWQIGLQPATGQ